LLSCSPFSITFLDLGVLTMVYSSCSVTFIDRLYILYHTNGSSMIIVREYDSKCAKNKSETIVRRVPVNIGTVITSGPVE
jgi:hypothetical protein